VFQPSVRLLRGTALGSIAANVGIVITGGVVRLTGSGLGCPTWPRCTDDSYIPKQALGIHGTIEFGNRTLITVVGLFAVASVLLAVLHRPRRPRLIRLAGLVLFCVVAQALVGGLTVRSHLNPDIVGGHFLISIGIVAAAFAFWQAIAESDEPAQSTVPGPLRALTAGLTAASLAVIVVGTLVTGSGPHAGDAEAARNNLDPETIAQIHADLVFLVCGLAIAAALALRAVAARPAATRAGWLIVVLAAQGVIGFVQYFTHVPAVLVAFHMAGACAVWLATLTVLYATRTRTAAQPTATTASPALASTSA
jgi:cytochrome c oxidase assembly protein subunit 15